EQLGRGLLEADPRHRKLFPDDRRALPGLLEGEWTADRELTRGLEAVQVGDRHLVRVGLGHPLDPEDADTIGPRLFETDRPEAAPPAARNVWGRAAHLVQNLPRHGGAAHEPARAGRLRDEEGPVRVRFDDRVADRLQSGALPPAREVPAARLRAALDDV